MGGRAGGRAGRRAGGRTGGRAGEQASRLVGGIRRTKQPALLGVAALGPACGADARGRCVPVQCVRELGVVVKEHQPQVPPDCTPATLTRRNGARRREQGSQQLNALRHCVYARALRDPQTPTDPPTHPPTNQPTDQQLMMLIK